MPKGLNMDTTQIFQCDLDKNGFGNAISVIHTTNQNGDIKPLRIRLDSPRQTIEANIDETTAAQYLYSTMLVFRCKITVDNIQYNIKLGYDIPDHIWRLMK